MKRLASDLDVLEAGCMLLINLATNGAGRVAPDESVHGWLNMRAPNVHHCGSLGGGGAIARRADKNRKLVAKEGGVDIILDCLRNGGGSPTLLLAASWAIRNVSAYGAHRSAHPGVHPSRPLTPRACRGGYYRVCACVCVGVHRGQHEAGGTARCWRAAHPHDGEQHDRQGHPGALHVGAYADDPARYGAARRRPSFERHGLTAAVGCCNRRKRLFSPHRLAAAQTICGNLWHVPGLCAVSSMS